MANRSSRRLFLLPPPGDRLPRAPQRPGTRPSPSATPPPARHLRHPVPRSTHTAPPHRPAPPEPPTPFAANGEPTHAHAHARNPPGGPRHGRHPRRHRAARAAAAGRGGRFPAGAEPGGHRRGTDGPRRYPGGRPSRAPGARPRRALRRHPDGCPAGQGLHRQGGGRRRRPGVRCDSRSASPPAGALRLPDRAQGAARTGKRPMDRPTADRREPATSNPPPPPTINHPAPPPHKPSTAPSTPHTRPTSLRAPPPTPGSHRPPHTPPHAPRCPLRPSTAPPGRPRYRCTPAPRHTKRRPSLEGMTASYAVLGGVTYPWRLP